MVWSREQCGEFLDAIEAERLYALYHLAAYYGLRRSELCGLAWAEVDLPGRRIHVRQAQVDDVLDSTKSADSERTIVIDQDTAAELLAWRKAQLAERMAWGSAWTDSGRVFTREDGTPLRPGWVAPGVRYARRPRGPAPVTLHGLRRRGHDAARGRPATEGHQRGPGAQHGRFHDGRLTPRSPGNWPTLPPRRSPHTCPARARSLPVVPFLCQKEAGMITDINQGACTFGTDSLVRSGGSGI